MHETLSHYDNIICKQSDDTKHVCMHGYMFIDKNFYIQVRRNIIIYDIGVWTAELSLG